MRFFLGYSTNRCTTLCPYMRNLTDCITIGPLMELQYQLFSKMPRK